MSKPDVTVGNATKRADYLNLVKFVAQGDYIDGSGADTTLTTADFGRTVIINSASARTVYLPSVDTPQIGGWFRVIKLGAGDVTVQAADSDTINGGVAGGSIICNVAGETFAYITLRLVSATAWVIESGMGSWNTSASMFLLGYPDGPLLKQISTPAIPAAGYNRLYSKSDKRLYTLDEDGLELQLPAYSEMIPVMGTRRWAAMRVSGTAFLQSLFDGVEAGGVGGAGSTTFSSTIPHYARLITNNQVGDYRRYFSQNSSILLTPDQNFDVTFRIQFETLANFRAWIGLSDGVFNVDSDNPSGRHFSIFRFSTDVGANIYAVTKDGTTINAVDTGIAAAASWFSLRMVSTSGQVEFYVNGIKTNTLTANLPTTNMIALVQAMTLTTAPAYFRLGSIAAIFNG
jgi:hypothetical protein